MGRKSSISFAIFLLRAFLLVSETYHILQIFSYQNLGNAPLMLKNRIENTLFLTLIFIFYKTVNNSLQFFDIFCHNQLKLINLLYIVNVKNVK